MNDVVTLKSLSSLAIEHEADFEIFHGETTHKDKRVRAQMILSLEGCPEVRVSFGDAKHGQRISSIALASNPKITVKQEHLLPVLEDHRTSADWRRTMTRETPLFNIRPVEDNLICISANIVRRLSRETLISGGNTETWDEYEVRIENHVSVTGLGIHTTESTVFYIKVDNNEHPEFREMWEEGLQEAEVIGEYVFRNTLKFRKFRSDPSAYWSAI
jgi:hypothetical protein